MWNLVLGFFQLILGVFSKLDPDVINEKLEVIGVFLQEDLEFWLFNCNNALMMVLVLSLPKIDNVAKKKVANKIWFISVMPNVLK